MSIRLARLLPLTLLLAMGGCELVGDILEFGFWVGAIAVVGILLVVWLIARAFRGGR